MKRRRSVYYPIFFTICMLASMFASAFQNVHNAIPNSIYSSNKHVSISHQEKKVSYIDFLCEENETETESSLDFKLWSNILFELSTFFKNASNHPDNLDYISGKELKINPIYISVCNFRI